MISENFSREEFACKCGCGFNTADKELVHILEKVRTKFNSPVTINSALCCLAVFVLTLFLLMIATSLLCVIKSNDF